MKTEVLILNEERNVTLTAYIQKAGGAFRHVAKRPAVLILPGGGYQACEDQEGDPVAFEYLKAGYQAFILRYSVKEHAIWPNPLTDYENAMKLIRSRSEEWFLYPDKVVVIGFSAGGHLAACAATMSVNRPNAAILGYAAVKKSIIGSCVETAPDAVEAVDRKTCPCFLFASREDRIVDVVNTIDMMHALAESGVSFEGHIYAFGPHGCSTANSSIQTQELICSRLQDWVPDSIAWLKEVLGDFKHLAMTEPVCGPHVSGDYDDCLSIRCTMEYLWKCKGAEAVMKPLTAWLEENKERTAASIGPMAYQRTKQDGMKGFCSMIKYRTLEEVLSNTGLSKENIGQIDQKLKLVYNEGRDESKQ